MNNFPIIPLTKKAISIKKLTYGVGINDANYQVQPRIKGIKYMCPFYQKWQSMLNRAYNKKYIARQPTYIGISVCYKWLTFSNFKRWMEKQDWVGKALDKDIIYPNNKEYSPKTCYFVLQELNNLFTETKAIGNIYPKGVSINKNNDKYVCSLSRRGKILYLGSFNTINEAHVVYIKARINYVKTFYPTVPKKVKKGLKRHVKLLKKELALARI